MDKPQCHFNGLLAGTLGDYTFNAGTRDFLRKTMARVISNYGQRVENVLYIHIDKNGYQCDQSKVDIVRDIMGSRSVICLAKGEEIEMIENAHALVFGGGDLGRLSSDLASFGPTLWSKMLSGIPVLAWNDGATLISSLYLNGSANLCADMDDFSLLILPHYLDDTTGYQKVVNAFQANLSIEYVLCLTDREMGSGIVIEDSRSGLAGGTGTDGSGPGPNNLIIFQRTGQSSINRVPLTAGQLTQLPINYW